MVAGWLNRPHTAHAPVSGTCSSPYSSLMFVSVSAHRCRFRILSMPMRVEDCFSGIQSQTGRGGELEVKGSRCMTCPSLCDLSHIEPEGLKKDQCRRHCFVGRNWEQTLPRNCQSKSCRQELLKGQSPHVAWKTL